MNFIDIHCHPSLKIWLFDHHIYDEQHPHGLGLEFSENMFVNLPVMKEGGVNAAVAVHYLPEGELRTDLMARYLTDIAYLAIRLLCGKKLDNLIEDKSTPTAPFSQIQKYIAKFEGDIAEAQKSGFNAVIAKNFTEFNNLINSGKTVFIHSVEGLHCLGTKEVDLTTAKANLKFLYDAGVCQITLAHFFENVVVSSQGGIPPTISGLIGYDPATTYPKGYNETNNFAIEIIDTILDMGMIIDLVHCTPDAVKMVYARNDVRADKKRPLIFSHTGVREIATKPPANLSDRDTNYLPDTSDILKIKECNGVLGIIFMDYWLYGKETTKPGLEVVIETIEFIKGICGNYDNIAIGSDLDGFTEVPSDLAGEDYMKDLVNKLLEAGVTQDDVEKICFKNYLRVLQLGWGSQT